MVVVGEFDGDVVFYWDRGRPRPHVGLEVFCGKSCSRWPNAAGEAPAVPVRADA
jgi:hypothetical protein